LPFPIDPNDVFMHSKVDRRIIHRLATEVWQLTLSYLPVPDVIPHVPRCCKYLNDEVVWGRNSGPLLWGEMAPGVLSRGDHVHNNTALMRACGTSAPVAHAISLLAAGVNVNAVAVNGYTALNYAIWNKRLEMVCVLLDARADPNIPENNGWTPLMRASDVGHPAMVSALIASGSMINQTDHRGWTALMWACIRNRVDCARILIDAGADITVRNNGGRTALDISSHLDIAQMLQADKPENLIN
jgi:hypothetical protein